MLKATVNNGKAEVVVSGDMADICSEIAVLISSIAKNLGDEDTKKMFMAVFTSGFVNGTVYDISREEMDNIMIDAYRMADVIEDIKHMVRGKHEAK